MNIFTTLSQVIGGPPRHAEHADTRQEIKRHDPDQPDRERGEPEDDREDLFGDDSTVVSVDSLSVFLQNFLKSQSEEEQNQALASTSHEKQSGYTPKPRGQAAYAASIYARNSQASNPSQQASASPAISETLLGGEDIRLIHDLLDNIKDLQAQNIKHLTIEKGSSFLMSLKTAVDKAKNG